MIRNFALGVVFIAALILWVVLREDRLSARGKVPLGRLRKLWVRNERRIAPRYRLDWEVRYRRPEKAPDQKAKTRDVSQTGACLIVEERLSPGSALELEFVLPNQSQPIWFLGEVVWQKELSQSASQGNNRIFYVGIQFKNLNPQIEKELTQALKP